MLNRTTHGKLFLQGLTVLIACAYMVACGEAVPEMPSQSTSESPAASQAAPEETAVPSDTPQQTAPAATLKPEDAQKLEASVCEKMDLLLGWGEGTAGSSLAVVGAAHDIVQWCDDAQIRNICPSEVDCCIEKWLGTLDEESYQNAVENWSAVKEMAAGILRKDPSLKPMLEDSGCDYIESESAEQHWTFFAGRVDILIEK